MTPNLTPREWEVLNATATGLTNSGVGALLGISPSTVKNHHHSTYIKLGVGGMVEAFLAVGIIPAEVDLRLRLAQWRMQGRVVGPGGVRVPVGKLEAVS